MSQPPEQTPAPQAPPPRPRRRRMTGNLEPLPPDAPRPAARRTSKPSAARRHAKAVKQAMNATAPKPKRPSQRGQKGTRGAPKWVLTDELKRRITAMFGFGLTEEKIMVILDISAPVWAANRVEILEQCGKGLALAEMNIRKSCYESAIAGSFQHLQFFAKWALGYRETTRVEQTGADGGPVRTHEMGWDDEGTAARLRTLIDTKRSVVLGPPTVPPAGGSGPADAAEADGPV